MIPDEVYEVRHRDYLLKEFRGTDKGVAVWSGVHVYERYPVTVKFEGHAPKVHVLSFEKKMLDATKGVRELTRRSPQVGALQ